MKIFNLKEAAAFLKIKPEVLRRKAAKGDIPGSKPGKSWCFFEDDLVQYLKSFYATPVKSSWGVVETIKETTWHSTKEVKRGGSRLATKASVYNNLLGLPIK